MKIYSPMLCSHSSAASGRRGVSFEELMGKGGWIADTKLDGVRILAHWDHGVVLANRVGVVVNHRYPDIVTALASALAGMPPLALDGEVIAKDGSFESTLLRDQAVDTATIARRVETHPVNFVAFDMPSADPWNERRDALEEMARDWTDTLAVTVVSESADFLTQTRALGMEGVVAKRVNARYEFGKRSRSWVKFRNTFRVTALAIGYTPGTGSRAHFGAMRLVMLEDGEPIDVGRVGTGFTDREIPFLKLALDRGDVLPVEIECANVTKERTLRFPVFKYVRSDVGAEAFNVDQLEHIPTC